MYFMNTSSGLSFDDHCSQRNQVLTEENFYLPNCETKTVRCIYRTMKLGSLINHLLSQMDFQF